MLPMSGTSQPDVSLVVPAWNEADVIEDSVRMVMGFADAHQWNLEIVVVDDGSTDGTADRVRGLEDDRVNVLQLDRNRGKGAAVRTGMLAAQGRKVLFTDADIPYRLSDLATVVERLDDAPIVVGDRTLQGAEFSVPVSLLRRMASVVFSQIINLLITDENYDTQCGLKGFTQEAAQMVFGKTTFDHFGFDVEIIYIALKQGYRIDRVAVVLERNRRSSVSVVRDSLLMLRDLFRLKWNHLRGRYTQ